MLAAAAMLRHLLSLAKVVDGARPGQFHLWQPESVGLTPKGVVGGR
jgi:hypothetical protein